MKALMHIKETLIGYERIAKSPTYATIYFLVISQLVAWLSFFAVKPNAKLSLFFGVLLAGFVVMPVYYTTRLALLKRAVGWQLAALLANSFIQVVLYFAAVYFAYGTAGNFNAPISRIDAIYFSLGMLTTAGTGQSRTHERNCQRGSVNTNVGGFYICKQ
jgi:hypothetical protein